MIRHGKKKLKKIKNFGNMDKITNLLRLGWCNH